MNTKNTYAAPAVITSTDAIRTTNGPPGQTGDGQEPEGESAPGAVGFYL